jgi:hypothetical protein
VTSVAKDAELGAFNRPAKQHRLRQAGSRRTRWENLTAIPSSRARDVRAIHSQCPLPTPDHWRNLRLLCHGPLRKFGSAIPARIGSKRGLSSLRLAHGAPISTAMYWLTSTLRSHCPTQPSHAARMRPAWLGRKVSFRKVIRWAPGHRREFQRQ